MDPDRTAYVTTSLARNLAIRSINFSGTASSNGKRIVPLSILYRRRSSTRRALGQPAAVSALSASAATVITITALDLRTAS